MHEAVTSAARGGKVEALDSAKVGVVADLLSATQVGYVLPAKIQELLNEKLRIVAPKLTQTQVVALDAIRCPPV